MNDARIDIGAAWMDAQARLPDGWTLEGLRCASTGLDADSRSEDWVAVATGPSGEERSHRADEPLSVLDGLVATFGVESPEAGSPHG